MFAKALLTAVVLCAAAVACPAREVDGVAAKVNDSVILKSEVVSEMRRAGVGPDRYAEILNEMIERRLVVAAAQEAKMTMQEWVVDNRVREIIDRAFGGDRNRLMDALAKQKVAYPEWRKRLRDDLVVSAMRWQTIDKNVVASPAVMREEYAKNPARYRTQAKTTVSVILLKPEEAAKRAVVSEALRKEPFADVARRYSSDARAAQGGVWKDVVPAEVFRPEVCEELAKMPRGTISHWIDLDGWSFLLRKDEESPARALSFAEAYEAVEASVRERQAAQMYAAWLTRLKAAAYIKVFE
jgi:parvulin-like peptidyl-prolyl isomerase